MLLKEYIGGISAGFLIGIGGTVFLACDNNFVGAALFTVALLVICFRGYALYTGRVGFLAFAHGKSELLGLAMCLLGNITGTVITGRAIRNALPLLAQKAAVNCTLKLETGLLPSFTRAVFCGMLMYLAVAIYRKNNSIAGILFCVPVFILSGFEHSVANMFYLALAPGVAAESFLYLAVIVAGNSEGALVISIFELIMQRLDKKNKAENE